jgi:hypothetical protein
MKLRQIERKVEAFRCHVNHFQCLVVPMELLVMAFVNRKTNSITASLTGIAKYRKWCTWHRKLVLKSQVTENFTQ